MSEFENKRKQLRSDIFLCLDKFKREALNFSHDELMEMVVTILQWQGYGAEVFFYAGFIDKCVYEWAILNDIKLKK